MSDGVAMDAIAAIAKGFGWIELDASEFVGFFAS